MGADARRSLRDETGAVIRWYGTITDIDDRKRAEQELQQLKEQLQKENIALRDEITQTSMFEEIVGSSTPLRRLLGLVAKVASTDSTVLITGESGTGKEMIARAIHRASPRRDKPFVPVNCGAIPSELVESQLFGHEKGAFTGAVQRHLGRFELADRGTIFLDEVGELPRRPSRTVPRPAGADLRARRRHQGDSGGRAGGRRDEPRPRQGDRGRVVPERPLLPAERLSAAGAAAARPPADIPLLTEYLAQRYAALMGKTITSVSQRTMDLLTSYAWPGNVRELQNVIQRAVILCEGTLVVDEAWFARRSTRRGAVTQRPWAG